MYFDEDLILDIRLNTLNNHVDKFIIAEATRNHAGQKKKLNFKIENYSKFRDKIKYLVIDDLPLNVKSPKKGWHENHARDQFQRNSLERGYNEFSDEDLIMISDIDEIPNPSRINEFNIKNKFACFIQRNFQSKLNLLNITEGNWPGTKICQKKKFNFTSMAKKFKSKEKTFLENL